VYVRRRSRDDPGERSTSISCLAVRGSAAVAGRFGVLETTGLGPEGPVHETRNTGFVVVVQDDGAPPPPPPDGPFPTTVDDFNHSYAAAPDCAAPGIGPVRFPWIGDFTVVDAPSGPTSKDACKAGGWKRYGTAFKKPRPVRRVRGTRAEALRVAGPATRPTASPARWR
jgi:hypothetical protein